MQACIYCALYGRLLASEHEGEKNPWSSKGGVLRAPPPGSVHVFTYVITRLSGPNEITFPLF